MLAKNLKKVLASTYVLSIKTQQFHWNVMGPDFEQFHSLFGRLYEEISEPIDVLAETIRTLGEFAPGSLQEFMADTLIVDEESTSQSALVMVERLIEDTETIIDVVKTAYETAELEHEYDVSDILASILATHKKHAWMLHSIMGQQRRP